MSTNDSREERSTEREKIAVDAATGGFEVRSDPNDETRLEVKAIPSLEGGILALGIRSEHLNGRVFLTPEQAEEIVFAVRDRIDELQEYTE